MYIWSLNKSGLLRELCSDSSNLNFGALIKSEEKTCQITTILTLTELFWQKNLTRKKVDFTNCDSDIKKVNLTSADTWFERDLETKI